MIIGGRMVLDESIVPGRVRLEDGRIAAIESDLRGLAPGVLLAGMRRFDPVPESVLDAARERARRGRRLGEIE